MERLGEVAKCNRVQRKKTIICAGSLNKRIDIYARELLAPLNPGGNEYNYREDFSTLLISTWAMIQTPQGKTIFDEVTGATVIDTIFYIRYTPIMAADTERWVQFNLKRYAIQNVINLEDNSLFLQLNTRFKGLITAEASKS